MVYSDREMEVSAPRLEGELLRRMARWGSRGPEWFVRVAPPIVGLVACAVAGDRRRFVADNLRRVRGKRGALEEALDVARLFTGYATCLAEVLGAGVPRGRTPEALVRGELHLHDALADGRGIVFVTAHTAGWETVGPLLSRDQGLEMMIVERAEKDRAASAIQDRARQAHGLRVAHVGDDPLSALPLVHHLRSGGVVAVQIDRVPSDLRTRGVTLFGRPARIPDGPLHLAAMTGAPILPVFAARTGHRCYEVELDRPVRVARGAPDPVLDRA
ncbi:MAG TPA: lysophospholipid acyltransferase family protein, partial [Polyangiaceae bacterium]